jgi:hypothetical protein
MHLRLPLHCLPDALPEFPAPRSQSTAISFPHPSPKGERAQPACGSPGKRKKTDEPPKGAQLLSPGRQVWELKANAIFRSAEGRRAAQRSDMERSAAVERGYQVPQQPVTATKQGPPTDSLASSSNRPQ